MTLASLIESNYSWKSHIFISWSNYRLNKFRKHHLSSIPFEGAPKSLSFSFTIPLRGLLSFKHLVLESKMAQNWKEQILYVFDLIGKKAFWVVFLL